MSLGPVGSGRRSGARRERFVLGAVVVGALALSAALMARRFREATVNPAAAGWEEPPPEPAATAPVGTDAGRPPESPPPAYVRIDPASAHSCPAAMVLVDGIHCPFVAHRCERFLSEPDDVCKTFVPEALCEGRLARLRFCIDVFEYPNLAGVRPAVRVDFHEAERACAVEDKRLCTVDEWEFACEGAQMWPFPYGLERDADAYNIDRPELSPTAPEIARDPRRLADELARLDQRVASGDRERCISPFGVRDLTGNVAEWAVNPNGTPEAKPFRSATEGGGWALGPARCRATTTHPATWTAVDIGFRCCADAAKTADRRRAPETPSGPRRRRLVPP